MTAQGYFTESNRWVASKALSGLDTDGNLMDRVGSTLGVEQALRGPVDPREVLDMDVTSVYMLEPEDVSQTLIEALGNGDLFAFPFTYRSDWARRDAFLIANETGIYALVGEPVEATWCELEQEIPVDDDDDDEIDDGIDFEMF